MADIIPSGLDSVTGQKKQARPGDSLGNGTNSVTAPRRILYNWSQQSLSNDTLLAPSSVLPTAIVLEGSLFTSSIVTAPSATPASNTTKIRITEAGTVIIRARWQLSGAIGGMTGQRSFYIHDGTSYLIAIDTSIKTTTFNGEQMYWEGALTVAQDTDLEFIYYQATGGSRNLTPSVELTMVFG